MIPGTILLVDDNRSDIALTKRAFAKNCIAHHLVVAEDGQEALDYLSLDNGHVAPALILLDLKLPKISGLDVLRKIRADSHTRRIPVVILTSSQEERDIAAGYDSGANGYIHKPVDFNEFVGVVQQLGLYWLATNQTPPARNELRCE